MNSDRNPGEGWVEGISDGEDCDDSAPEIKGKTTWYKDEDNDGWYTEKQEACDSPGAGWTKGPINGEGDGCPKDECCHTDGLPFYEDKDSDDWYVKGNGNKCPTDVDNDPKLSRTNPKSTEDCDDGNDTIWSKNECGICTNDPNEGKVTCYEDKDGDGFGTGDGELKCAPCDGADNGNDYDDDCTDESNSWVNFIPGVCIKGTTPPDEPEIPEEEQKIDDAIEVMKEHLGKTYKLETSPRTLRTDETETAEEFMDCSEFVGRYLKEVGVTDQVKDITTASMTNEDDLQDVLDSDKIIFVPGSKDEDFVPKKGDIFVWRKPSGGGHTGLVTGVKADGTIQIMETIGSSGSREETAFNKAQGKGKIRESEYSKKSKALNLHGDKSWKGYFRPQL